MDLNFNTPSAFANIPIGGEFIKALTVCAEVYTRIESTTHKGGPVNAWRVGGKLVFMADWEPVFTNKSREQRLHDDLREVWALVTDRPGITLRALAESLGISKTKAFKLVNLLLESGTLVQDICNKRARRKSLRATVPLITIAEDKFFWDCYWECPECGKDNPPSVDDCDCED